VVGRETFPSVCNILYVLNVLLCPHIAFVKKKELDLNKQSKQRKPEGSGSNASRLVLPNPTSR
jgi:hypothetical protein